MSADLNSPKSDDNSGTSVRQRIYLVSHPKIVFMYPTFFLSILAGLYMAVAQDQQQDRSDTFVLSAVFLAVFALNLMVFSFDFPRSTSLALVLVVVSVVLALLLLFRFNDQLLPILTKILKAYHPQANATFYFSIAAILGVLFGAAFVMVRFDYWEVSPNELLHHHGMLSDLERYASPNLKIDKEINDVFEYLLLRSGRLILHPANEPRSIVLENVFFINRKEADLIRMLGALQVQVRMAPPRQVDDSHV